MCTDAMYAGMEILKPHINKQNFGVKGTIIIGVVEGDVHDLGRDGPIEE